MKNARSNEVNFGFGPILQSGLPEVPWMAAHTRRLPGIEPMKSNDWLRVDEVFDRQMALRDELARCIPDTVMGEVQHADEALHELLDFVLLYLQKTDGYEVSASRVIRPDGAKISIGGPILTLMRLVAEDLCIMQRQDDEHVLTAASLAFPAGWTLAQKLGKPLTRIHKPVPDYGNDIAQRVQRLFDRLRPENGITRTNALRSSTCELFRPMDENAPFENASDIERPYLRSERQCLIRLPKTGAIVFSIHTRIVRESDLTPTQLDALVANPIKSENRANA